MRFAGPTKAESKSSLSPGAGTLLRYQWLGSSAWICGLSVRTERSRDRWRAKLFTGPDARGYVSNPLPQHAGVPRQHGHHLRQRVERRTGARAHGSADAQYSALAGKEYAVHRIRHSPRRLARCRSGAGDVLRADPANARSSAIASVE